MFEDVKHVNTWIPSNSWKWPLIIMLNGWCYATLEDGIHSHMDHNKKWPSTNNYEYIYN
jgi:hypothetical protein